MSTDSPWYELFSRGARDWLRHNQKVADAVRETLPELLAGGDLISRPENRTVLVPVRMLEHARFRLRRPEGAQAAGQGRGQPGDVLRPGRPERGDDAGSSAGSARGELRFVIELGVDDILDWLWDELELPDLKPKRSAALDEPEYRREGWDKRGARARLDRRRTVKEAVKRRAIQEDPLDFVDEDLRFRQLVRRTSPAMNAAVVFALDVSASMGERERKLAKAFFFFALHGIRRRYARVEVAFIAHTTEAWEFDENQFFSVAGDGGTAASSAFALALDLIRSRFDPARYNSYFFYASDGENGSGDRSAAAEALAELAATTNYAGFVEIGSKPQRASTQVGELFAALRRHGLAAGSARIAFDNDLWQALRHFFREQAAEAA